MRMSVPAALAALVLGPPVLFVPIVLADAAPARAAAIFLEVNPSTAPAGDDIGLRASCDDNLKSATVTSGLFGTIVSLTDSEFVLAAAPGVHLRFDRRAIGLVVPSNQPEGSTDQVDAPGPDHPDGHDHPA